MTQELKNEKNPGQEAAVLHPLPKQNLTSALKNFDVLPKPSQLVGTTLINNFIGDILTSPEQLLKTLKGIALGYTLDCFGCCTMPVVFQVNPTETAISQVNTDSAVFECEYSLPTLCEAQTQDMFIIKNLASGQSLGAPFLKVKIGLHGLGWCDSNDKIDVFLMQGSKETLLGNAFRERKYCGYKWQINTPENTPKYIVENDKNGIASCCRLPCGICKQITFQIKDSSGKNVDENAGIIKVISCLLIIYRIGPAVVPLCLHLVIFGLLFLGEPAGLTKLL